MEELYMNIRKLVYERLDTGRDIDDAELYQVIDACIYEESRNVVIPIRQKEELKKRLYNSIKKLDILQELLEDDSVTEIMVNGSDSIFIERNGHMEKWDKKFESVERLSDVAQRIAAMSNRKASVNSQVVVQTELNDFGKDDEEIYVGKAEQYLKERAIFLNDCKIDGESSPVATNSPEKAIRIFNALRKLEIN